MKSKFRTIILLYGIIGIIAFSCGKDKKDQPTQRQNVPGLILFYGEPAVDGCGWLIKVDNELYAPILLDPLFKKDSLEVIIDFNVLNTTWNCGWISPGYSQIDIKNIKNQ